MKIPDFLKGTNFYVAALVVISGFWVGFTVDDAQNLIFPIFSAGAAIFAIRNKLKGQTPVSWKEWWANPNTKSYLGILLVQIVPKIPGEFFSTFTTAVDNVINKNWPALFSSLISLGTILFFWIKGFASGGAKVVVLLLCASFIV